MSCSRRTRQFSAPRQNEPPWGVPQFVPSVWLPALSRVKDVFNSPSARGSVLMFQSLLDTVAPSLPVAHVLKYAGAYFHAAGAMKSVSRVLRPSGDPTTRAMFPNAVAERLEFRPVISSGRRTCPSLADVPSNFKGGLCSWLSDPHEGPWQFPVDCGDMARMEGGGGARCTR